MLKKPACGILLFLTLLLASSKPAHAAGFNFSYFWNLPNSLFRLRAYFLYNLTPKVLGENYQISPTPSVTPGPTLIPTLTPSPTPTLAPQPQEALSTSDDAISNYIMSEINNFRRLNGLSVVQNDTYTCDFAKLRAQEISKDFNHSGFRSRLENGKLPYPSYSNVTENIAENYDYKNVVASWIDSPGHAENMKADTPFVCVEKYGTYYAYEGLRL